jgi:NDP-sugar pyrophosphorylase family protein
MGGYATRLGRVTENIPKALVDVGGRPFVARQLELLAAQGIERVVLCVGHLGEMIAEAVGDGARFGLTVDYSFDGDRPRGTAGALARAAGKLGPAFFTLYGDSYLTCDMAAIKAAFEMSGKSGLMSVYRNKNRWGASNVEYAGGRIAAYDKKNTTPRMEHIDYGLGVFKREVFEKLPPDRACDLEAVYQDLLTRGELAAFESPERFYEIGSPEGLEEARRYLAGKSGR